MLKCYFDERTDNVCKLNGLIIVSNIALSRPFQTELERIKKKYKLSLHAKNDLKDKFRRTGAVEFIAATKKAINNSENGIFYIEWNRTNDFEALAAIWQKMTPLKKQFQIVKLHHDTWSWSADALDFINLTLKTNNWDVIEETKGQQSVWIGCVDYLLHSKNK